jgi:hypothetical protein
VSWPAPATLLRHRPPAVLVEAIASSTGDALACRGVERASWRWPELLEGAAQTAGLLTGMQPHGLDRRAVIAEYRDVRIHAATHPGPVEFTARLDRRILAFWRCRVEARAADGTLLLAALVTLAPPAAA